MDRYIADLSDGVFQKVRTDTQGNITYDKMQARPKRIWKLTHFLIALQMIIA